MPPSTAISAKSRWFRFSTFSARCRIHLAQPEEGAWVYSTNYTIGSSYASGPLTMRGIESIYRTRVQAIRAAVQDLTKRLDSHYTRNAKEMPAVHAWLDKLWTMPDPDWTEDMAEEATK
jgi:hypothetical protein